MSITNIFNRKKMFLLELFEKLDIKIISDILSPGAFNVLMLQSISKQFT
jgi:hypothetical protein